MAKKQPRLVVPRLFFSIFVILLVISVFGNGYAFYRAWENNRVTAVPDGDSLDLADGRRIRLLALDAPERGRCMADEAKNGLSNLVLGRHVRLKNTVKDSFGRTLAIVIIEEPRARLEYLRWRLKIVITAAQMPMPDPLVNRVMVSHGWARLESAPGPYADGLKSASQTAKDGKLGIYSPLCRNLSSSTACTVKGNIRYGKKTYHYPGCDNYDQVIVDLSYGDSWFCSQKEAMALGFSKASGCR